MKSIAGVGVLAAALGGCATITRGTTEQVQILSDPNEAQVATSLGQTCVTPCNLKVDRKDNFTVSFQKDGYEPQQVEVKTQTQVGGVAAVAGNVLIGGVVGATADAVTGAALDHVPNPVQVSLVAVKPLPTKPTAAKKHHITKKPKPASTDKQKPVS